MTNPQEAQSVSERAQQAVERIQEDERLRGDLEDPAARALVGWASAQVASVAGDPARSDADVEQAVMAIRRAARSAARSGALDAEQVVAAALELLQQEAGGAAGPPAGQAPAAVPVPEAKPEAPATPAVAPARATPAAVPESVSEAAAAPGPDAPVVSAQQSSAAPAPTARSGTLLARQSGLLRSLLARLFKHKENS